MSEFTRCPHCGLTHTRRPDGHCPKCHGTLGDSLPASIVAAPAGAVAQSVSGAAAAPRNRSVLGTLGSAGGAVIGIGASQVFGIALVIPMVVALIVGVVLVKAGPVRARPFVPAVSVLVGHLAWIVVGALFAASVSQIVLDAVLMLAGAAWLLARPGLAPVLLVGIFEVLTLAVNAWQTTTPELAGNEKALVLHVLLRAAVIVGLVVGYVKVRAQERTLERAALARTFE